MCEELIPMTDDEIATVIAVAFASRKIKAPILSGSERPVDPVERDRLRDIFARDLVAHLKRSKVRFMRAPPQPFATKMIG